MATELVFAVPDELVDELAARVAERIGDRRDQLMGWMNVDQAAEYLACPPSRIYDLVSQERVRFAKDGRRTLFKREWLDEVLTTSGVQGPRR